MTTAKRNTSNTSASIMAHAASMRNPPKGYGSIEAGMKVAAYRSKRLKYWAAQIGNGKYTDQVFVNAEADVVAEWGKPF
jgi:hypothetical protein